MKHQRGVELVETVLYGRHPRPFKKDFETFVRGSLAASKVERRVKHNMDRLYREGAALFSLPWEEYRAISSD